MIRHSPPEPAVGTILEVGCRPLPDRALSGDLLTFEHLPNGWVERHNHSPHDRPVSWETVAWWHPWRAVDSGPSRVRGHRSAPRWRDLRDEGEAA